MSEQKNNPMEENNQEEYLETNIITLLDEEGQEHEFELIDTLHHQDNEYRALVPVFDDPEEMLQDSAELVIMRVSREDGEIYLDIIEDDDEYDRVSDLFVQRLADDYDILNVYDDDEYEDEDDDEDDE